jgi:hypothetical protein
VTRLIYYYCKSEEFGFLLLNIRVFKNEFGNVKVEGSAQTINS